MKARWISIATVCVALQLASGSFGRVRGDSPPSLSATALESSEDEGWLVRPGGVAPAFELKDTQGNLWRLSDFSGRPVVLFFFGSR